LDFIILFSRIFYLAEQGIKCLRNFVPSISFKEIIKNNPNKQYMQRIKILKTDE